MGGFLIGVLIAGAVATGGAGDAAPTGREAVRAACKADVQALCAGIEPGGGRIMACMRQNRDKVSAGCQEAFRAAREARKSQKGSQVPALPVPSGTQPPAPAH